MLTFVFVHGLSGWGSYDSAYSRMPYWGMRGGDLMAFLQKKGYDCYAASVSPAGSAWDRACELYAQLTGKTVDYGESHSRRFGHARFGRDFSSCPLIPGGMGERRLVLIGHSFGGATARLFAELYAHGDEDERKTADPSPFFLSGAENPVRALVTLASPLNGTTAYDLFEDEGFQPDRVKVPWWSVQTAGLMSRGLRSKGASHHPQDCAAFDMHVDNALALNRRMPPLPDTYYFSVPCCSTVRREDGTCRPDIRKTEPLFVQRSYQIGCWQGRTKGGFQIGEEWLENDGLVNTCSAAAPLDAPKVRWDGKRAVPGVWNILPTFDGDHMSLQGGLMRKRNIRPFFLNLLEMISFLPDPS